MWERSQTISSRGCRGTTEYMKGTRYHGADEYTHNGREWATAVHGRSTRRSHWGILKQACCEAVTWNLNRFGWAEVKPANHRGRCYQTDFSGKNFLLLSCLSSLHFPEPFKSSSFSLIILDSVSFPPTICIVNKTFNAWPLTWLIKSDRLINLLLRVILKTEISTSLLYYSQQISREIIYFAYQFLGEWRSSLKLSNWNFFLFPFLLLSFHHFKSMSPVTLSYRKMEFTLPREV